MTGAEMDAAGMVFMFGCRLHCIMGMHVQCGIRGVLLA
jgi:hypothetical protein